MTAFTDLRAEIAAVAEEFISAHPGNRLPDSDHPYLERPLLGVSSAADPIYQRYRVVIGPFHLLPEELLPGAVSVISWILPLGRAVRISNRSQRDLPSREWALTRTHGEAINGDLRRYLAAWLTERGFQAVIPQYSPLWKEYRDTPAGIASTWSERHAAYAAGLGSFSLSDGLITAAGIAHRCGSIITDLPLSPTPRPDTGDHRFNCLAFHNNSCLACIARCPVGAITRDGHDKNRCRELVYGDAPRLLSQRYGVPQTGCGLCQTAVPCEQRIPAGISRQQET